MDRIEDCCVQSWKKGERFQDPTIQNADVGEHLGGLLQARGKLDEAEALFVVPWRAGKGRWDPTIQTRCVR